MNCPRTFPLDRFDENGCALLRRVLPETVLQPVRQLVSREVDRRIREHYMAGRLSGLYEEEGFERRLALAYQGSGLDERKWNDFLFSREMYDLSTHPGLIYNLKTILGEDIIFHGDYQVVPKLPGSEWTAFPWHQDTWYYGEPSGHMLIITVWIPLVETTLQNGCLWVVPGSHEWGLLPAVRGEDLNVRTCEDIEDRGEACAVPMRPGDVLFMTNMTFHASFMNQSDSVRWSLDIGYSSSPDVKVMDSMEKRSYTYLYSALKHSGRTLLRVSDSNASGPESYAVWCDRAVAWGNSVDG